MRRSPKANGPFWGRRHATYTCLPVSRFAPPGLSCCLGYFRPPFGGQLFLPRLTAFQPASTSEDGSYDLPFTLGRLRGLDLLGQALQDGMSGQIGIG